MVFLRFLAPALWVLFAESKVGRVLLWVWKFLSGVYFLNWIWNLVSGFLGYMYAMLLWLMPDLWIGAMKAGLKIEGATGGYLGKNIHRAVTTFMGIPISEATVKGMVDGNISDTDMLDTADAFLQKLDGVFDIPAVAAGYLARTPGQAEHDNFKKFIALNARVQIGGMITEIVKDQYPKFVAAGIGGIPDHINKLLGLEDAQEEILEPFMEKLIVEGLNKRYNRETLPVDLSPSDAVDAFVRGYIPSDVMHQILDNEGIRQNIRQTLIDLKAKNLSEADFRDLYQRGVWTQDDVKAGYVGNGYLDADALRKTALIVLDREWALRRELLNVKEQQFAHGLLDEAAFRAFLATLYFTDQEVDLEIEIGKGKASMHKATKPKAIAGTFNVAPWRVKPGASAMMSWNIRNADSITISGIGTVGPHGERVITPDVSQTYYLDASSDTDSERFEAAVQVGDTKELKRPTVSFSASPGRIQIGTPVELKWTTNNADSVSIDQVGPVAESGAVPVFPFISTIYTLRARNAAGERIVQDIVFVALPDIDLNKERRPGLSFSITPGVVKAKQPSAEVKWSITRAEGGTITFPDGSTQNVGRNGAMIVTASASGIFTLKASNLFGETQNQEALIFEGAEDDTPPPDPGTVPPVVFLSVSPGTALPAENLFVFWQISGAVVGTMIFADGTTRQVGASGSQQVAAPSVPGQYEFRLQAENAKGPSSQSVIIVVSTAG